ncbi:ATP-binding cassette domain-containing protein [Paenibacillus spiritus]|nr:ATP-binding cassette domain-containing protein [Paenibacillus spiritus]
MRMIEARQLALSLREGAEERKVLRGIDLEVEQGSWLALTGPNGSGKSSLIRTFNGLLSPASGSLAVAGLDLSVPAHRTAVRRSVQIVFQNPEAQTVGSTPAEDVAFGLENRGIPGAELHRRTELALARTGLVSKAEAPVESLSGGERQRLAVACCLALEPELLILDEPTAMLDPAGRRELFMLVRRLRDDGLTVVWVTQRPEELAASARVAVLKDGLLVYDGAPRPLFYDSPWPDTLGWEPPLAVAAGRVLLAQGWPLAELPLTEADLEAVL